VNAKTAVDAAPTATTSPAGATTATAATATEQPVVPTTATTPVAPPNPIAQVRVKVLDARLFTDETASGRRQQRARVTARIRAENVGSTRIALTRPALRIGSVRVPTDAGAPDARLDPLGAGAAQTVTLRFALAGEATPKIVRDRRARILIAGQSVAIRVKLREPQR
jgi:hypothetical protein